MTFMRSKSPAAPSASTSGFTLVEVIVSMAVTVVVMGALFAMLSRGLRSTPIELERADLQNQARLALENISRDALHAGAGLPLEFPAFTPPSVNPELAFDDGGPGAIEIVGSAGQGAGGVEPVRVVTFDGHTARTEVVGSFFQEGDLVLIYDDEPTNGKWMFGLVSSAGGGDGRELTLDVAPGSTRGANTLPPFIDNYNRPSPTSGFIIPVTVVTYTTLLDSDSPLDDGSRVLSRKVNWGRSEQVAALEDLQIRYFIGDMVADGSSPPPDLPRDVIRYKGDPEVSFPLIGAPPDDLRLPGPQVPHGVPFRDAVDSGDDSSEGLRLSNDVLKGSGKEVAVLYPPVPQPNLLAPLDPSLLVRGVSISVTSRSQQGNLEGSTVREGVSAGEEGYLRATFSSRVTARNITFRLGEH